MQLVCFINPRGRSFYALYTFLYADIIMEVSNYFVSKIFAEVDVDNDGQINVEEAIKYIEATPEVNDVYDMFGRSMTVEQLEGSSASTT
jgi:hypothetical protein